MAERELRASILELADKRIIRETKQCCVSSAWINPLEVGETHMLPLDDNGLETLTVTLIDANHCPGSVMFLFEGYFGTILYTGDFRYSPSMLCYPPLSNKKKIDVLYLDNTNCDPEQKLPSRLEATNMIKEIIEKYPYHDIVIGVYNIGKESLLVDLAKTFKTWVVVSAQRLELLQILEMENVFTTEEGAGRIRLVDQSEVNYINMVRWNRVCPTLAILPTSRKVKIWHKDVHAVPYSDHSSFVELQEFVSRLEPSSIVPVVKTKACETYFQQYLSTSKHEQHCIKIPESVKNCMKKQNTCSEAIHLFKAPKRKYLPKGVVFESPVKSAHPADLNGQKSPLNKSYSESILQGHNLVKPSLKEQQRRSSQLPLTESTMLVPDTERTSSTSKMTSPSGDNMSEMPSLICWSPKYKNETVISDNPLSSESLIHNPSNSSLFHNRTLLDWKGRASLSILPLKKQSHFGPQYFHMQVERYLTKQRLDI
ncbi:5' exonuclease Apollo isoform X2 [Xenopus laevis]|uniref:5' exonuclease Apollo n=1 Tax=Xenopus laevis TaxID=8355 RepID=A0A8J0UHH7_XENLA|nr:5' exonuclease Apollo isoform X2 [Xenopus laevis]